MDAVQKVLNHVKFVPQQSTDKIGDLSIDNRGFCLQVCTKLYACAQHAHTVYVENCNQDVSQTAQRGAQIRDKSIYFALIGN